VFRKNVNVGVVSGSGAAQANVIRSLLSYIHTGNARQANQPSNSFKLSKCDGWRWSTNFTLGTAQKPVNGGYVYWKNSAGHRCVVKHKPVSLSTTAPLYNFKPSLWIVENRTKRTIWNNQLLTHWCPATISFTLLHIHPLTWNRQ